MVESLSGTEGMVVLKSDGFNPGKGFAMMIGYML